MKIVLKYHLYSFFLGVIGSMIFFLLMQRISQGDGSYLIIGIPFVFPTFFLVGLVFSIPTSIFHLLVLRMMTNQNIRFDRLFFATLICIYIIWSISCIYLFGEYDLVKFAIIFGVSYLLMSVYFKKSIKSN